MTPNRDPNPTPRIMNWTNLKLPYLRILPDKWQLFWPNGFLYIFLSKNLSLPCSHNLPLVIVIWTNLNLHYHRHDFHWDDIPRLNNNTIDNATPKNWKSFIKSQFSNKKFNELIICLAASWVLNRCIKWQSIC